MVDFCANPGCGKPLRYLRDGQIFIFEIPAGTGETGEKRGRHLEHFWVCGECSRTRTLTQDAAGSVRVVDKLPQIQELEDTESFLPGAAS